MVEERVLVVEDNTLLRQGIQTLLQRSGYQVSTAANGAEALEIMERGKPDLILADIMMPTIDGYGLYEAVRTRPEWRLIPFIFLTARARRDDVLKGKGLGAEDYLVKPVDTEELLVTVRAKLDRAGAVRETMESELDRIKESIADALSHELRTPLTWITAYTELAMAYLRTLPPEQVHTFLRHVLEGGERITRLADDLLTLIRLDNGRLKEKLSQMVGPCEDLDRVVEQAVQRCAGEADRADVTIKVVVDGPLPPVVLSEEFFGDALGRIVANAVKFSGEPGKKVWVTVRTSDGDVIIEVSDEGVGIPPHELPHIFERFRQIDRERLNQDGVGIGLAIAREFISMQGGEIDVESTPGEGSTFTIRMPASEKEISTDRDLARISP